MQKRIMFRLPDKMYEQVKQTLKKGKAETMSDLVRKALKQFLELKNDD